MYGRSRTNWRWSCGGRGYHATRGRGRNGTSEQKWRPPARYCWRYLRERSVEAFIHSLPRPAIRPKLHGSHGPGRRSEHAAKLGAPCPFADVCHRGGPSSTPPQNSAVLEKTLLPAVPKLLGEASNTTAEGAYR